MTILFAAASSPFVAVANPARRRLVIGQAANDNGPLAIKRELRAALRHFAEHGLGAATIARANAERAFFQGDRHSYLHWLAICHTLDRRMARILSARVDAGNA
ncbi:hypothetical protein RQP55_06430 [Novosphingobium sp. APW14]|uniref:hypothetical protein n=1 Tax=Novosphingobium sp. APW14 TaxID=3077237 RepID=UPI0028DE9300|nr:hypothetical protein [Novosphingobium sp. APW14]MDT9013062.1 hypothetical protein [Novosphingobium sp. APW14]